VVLRDFLRTQFDIYGVDTPIPEMDAGTAAREVPVPARWFLGQPCLLRTDKARTELGYVPVISLADGLDTVRAALAAGGR
jgi:nucleoside-diphosphate-sugar epimerase